MNPSEPPGWIDIGVVIFYLLGVTLLGVWAGRGVSKLSDFFMPRRFGSGMMIMHAFGTGTASDQAVTVSAATFRGGLSGIWYQWLWLFVTPFYWLIAPIFRRFRAVTTADVYELRFDRSVGVLFAVVGIVNMSVKIGVMLKGTSVLLESSTGGWIDPQWAILGVTCLFVLYGCAGGLAAAILTDYAQGLLTILFSVMLLPFVLAAVGGMQGVRETLADPQMLSLVAPGKITWFFIMMMSIQALVGIVAQPFIMGICAAGRSEWEGRVGFSVGNLVKRLCTMLWALTAIAALAWMLQQGIDPASIHPDHIYGLVARTFLADLMPGLLGLFIATILAGVMSSCDAYMVSSAALFTENIYRPARRDRSDRHYVWVGRVASLAVVIGGIGFANYVPNVIRALEIWFMIAPMMGLVFWVGLLWRRLNVAGAWSTTVTGFFVWWISSQGWFIDLVAALPAANQWRLVWTEGGQTVIYLPWQIMLYMAVAVTAGVLVSLVTRPMPDERLDRFYTLSRTPIAPGEPLVEPCVLPPTTPQVPRPMWITWAGLEIPRPSRCSQVGFLVVWLAVGLLIFGFAWFVGH